MAFIEVGGSREEQVGGQGSKVLFGQEMTISQGEMSGRPWL